MPIDFMPSSADPAAIDWITGRVVAAIERGDPGDAAALRFLLRRYCATDRADLRDALEPGLAEGLRCQAAAATIDERAAWLTLFAEAAAISDDDRLRAAGADLSGALRREWGRVAEVGSGAAGVEACLLAGSHLLDPQSIVPGAIDELERIVGAAYRPGGGLARSVDDPEGARGRLADHVRTASALLTAFDVSDRLPYPMLAEELIQFARESMWNDAAGLFCDPADEAQRSFAINCAAAGVLYRLAALHGRSDYRAAAVIRPDADYGRDAAGILRSLAGTFRDQDATGAAYGLALLAVGEFQNPNC
ncbi:MAG: hypothetical protein ABI868_21865 [Acidobacteriota bacterium]